MTYTKPIDPAKLFEFTKKKLAIIDIHNVLLKAYEDGLFSPDVPDIKVGDKVTHPAYKEYGIGIIDAISASGKKVRVRWPVPNQYHWAYYDPKKLVKEDQS